MAERKPPAKKAAKGGGKRVPPAVKATKASAPTRKAPNAANTPVRKVPNAAKARRPR